MIAGPRTGLPTARGHRAPHPAGLRPATIPEHLILPREAPDSFPTRSWDLPLRPRPFQASHRVIWDRVPLTPCRSLARSPGAFPASPSLAQTSPRRPLTGDTHML